MSRAWLTLDGTTLWFKDEPFAIWLRSMSLNLESSPSANQSQCLTDLSHAWLLQSELVGVSNVLGVDLDELKTSAELCIVHKASMRVQRLLRAFGDVVPSPTLELLGFTGNAASEINTHEILQIGDQLELLVKKRLARSIATAASLKSLA